MKSGPRPADRGVVRLLPQGAVDQGPSTTRAHPDPAPDQLHHRTRVPVVEWLIASEGRYSHSDGGPNSLALVSIRTGMAGAGLTARGSGIGRCSGALLDIHSDRQYWPG